MEKKKKRIFEIIQIGYTGDWQSRLFDVLITVAIVLNIFIAIADTFDELSAYRIYFDMIEMVTVIGFTVEYFLRIWTANLLYPYESYFHAIRKYALSFDGIIDFLSFVPYYLPFFFPSGIVAFRMFRVVRILRLFRINAYSDALSVISKVINRKKDQILSSVFIVLTLMLASSLCMYSVEHQAQPEVFKNAFSGFWWSVSTLLTVGYGDIYPVTELGKILSIAITILGVGIVAIPTGIISAGFVEEYNNTRRSSDIEKVIDLKFIRINVTKNHEWVSKQIKDLKVPEGLILATIIRKGEATVPRGDTVIYEGDQVVLGAQGYNDDYKIHIREIELKERSSWVGYALKDIDMSKHSLVLMVKRGSNILIPNGNTILKSGDLVFVYTKKNIQDSIEIDI